MRKPAVGIFTAHNEIQPEDLLVIKLCYANGSDVVFFTKNDVDFDKGIVNAKVWTSDGFVDELVEIPYYVECGSCVHKLRQKFESVATVIDNFKLSKKDVNDLLVRTKFAACVIPTIHTYKQINVLNFALMWREVIVKPLVGARGESIISIETQHDKFRFKDTDGNTVLLDYSESIEYIKKLYDDTTVIVQPRMKFFNKEGRIMDFRVNVEKNGEGKWSTIFMIARTSRDSIVSNFSAGGYASLIDKTLSIEYGENCEKIKAGLEEIARDLPPIIEEASECNMLSLGIDVAVDRDTLQPYIIEVNYVPKLTFPDKSVYLSTKADYFGYLCKQVSYK